MGGRASRPPEAPSCRGPSEARAGGRGGASARTRTFGAQARRSGLAQPPREKWPEGLGGLVLAASGRRGGSGRAVSCGPGDPATQNRGRPLLELPPSPDPGLLPHAGGMAPSGTFCILWRAPGNLGIGVLGRQTTLLLMASSGHSEGPPSGNLVKNFLEKQTGPGCRRLEPGLLVGSGHLHQVRGRVRPAPPSPGSRPTWGVGPRGLRLSPAPPGTLLEPR